MRLIIFDFFGVLGGEISSRWFNNHFSKEEAKRLKDKYFIPADNGIYTLDEVIKMMSLDLGFTYDEIYNDFMTNISTNYELFDYILKLRKKNKVALLSNCVKGLFELFYKDLDFNKYFDKSFISAYYKMQKPNFEFYNLCVKSFDEKFDEIYMIDDNIKNICDLDKINIKGIQYIDNEKLFKILDEFI